MSGRVVGVIGVPCAEQGRWSSFWGSVCSLGWPAGWQVIPAHGSSVAQNRNLLARAALEQGAERIFYLDDDLVFAPDALTRLLERAGDRPAVVGLSLRRQVPFKTLWFRENLPRMECMYGLGELPRDGSLVRLAAATSGGFLLATDVFRRIEPPWWTLGQFEGRADEWCDDLDFCRKLAAAGIPLYGDPMVRFGHSTKLEVWPAQDPETGQWMTVLARGTEPVFGMPVEERA